MDSRLCGRCKNDRPIYDYKRKKNGKQCLTCLKCQDYARQRRKPKTINFFNHVRMEDASDHPLKKYTIHYPNQR